MKKSNYIIFDCETGGFSEKENPITQIALLCIDDKLNEVDRFETFIAPYNDLKITSGALQTTGLKMSDINNGVTSKKAVELITTFFKSNMSKNHPAFRPVIIGHNVAFDIKFVSELFRLHKKDFADIRNDNPIDTQTLMKMYKPNISSLKLEVCCSEVGIELPDAHKAMNDVIATVDLFRALTKRLRTNKSKNSDDDSEQKKSRVKFQF